MEIKEIIIGDSSFQVADFTTDTFLTAVTQKLSSGKITSQQIESGLNILTQYRGGNKLNPSQQIDVARMLFALQAQAIIEGDIESLPNTEFSPQDRDIFKNIQNTFIQRVYDINAAVQQAYEINLAGQQAKNEEKEEGWNLLITFHDGKYGIYQHEDEGVLYYYACDMKDQGEHKNMMGGIVSDTGKKIETLDGQTEYYILMKNSYDSEIWFGSFQNGFDLVKKLYHSVIDGQIFYARDTIGVLDDDIVTLENLRTGDTIFRLEKKYCHSVVFVSVGKTQSIIYLGYEVDAKGNLDTYPSFFVTDENNLGEYALKFKEGATIIRYNGGVIIIEYDEEKQTYCLFDSAKPDLKIDEIQCFKDTSGKIYYDGKSYYQATSDGYKYFWFSKIDENGNILEGTYSTAPHFHNSDIKDPYHFEELPIVH